jgi:hypothetical protein
VRGYAAVKYARNAALPRQTLIRAAAATSRNKIAALFAHGGWLPRRAVPANSSSCYEKPQAGIGYTSRIIKARLAGVNYLPFVAT